jgi:hypothetical protein
MILSNHSEPWLLILDNADDINRDYSEYFPSGDYGSIILTSRNPELHKYADKDSTLPLKELSESYALNLFFDVSGIARNRTSEGQARTLVSRLQYHTLGVIQAASYVEDENLTLQDYLRLLRSAEENQELNRARIEVLQHVPQQMQSTYRSVFNAFEVSAAVLGDPKNADADELLGILSVYHHSAFRTTVFERAWRSQEFFTVDQVAKTNDTLEFLENFTEWHRDKLPKFLDLESQQWNPLRLRKAIKKLERLALVQRVKIGYDMEQWNEEDNEDGLLLHPLIHSWARCRQDVAARDKHWLAAAVSITCSKGEHMISVTRSRLSVPWPFMSLTEIHMSSLLQEPVDIIFSRGNSKDLAPMLGGIIFCLWKSESELLGLQAARIASRFLTSTEFCPLTLVWWAKLAAEITYRENKDLQTATPVYTSTGSARFLKIYENGINEIKKGSVEQSDQYYWLLQCQMLMQDALRIAILPIYEFENETRWQSELVRRAGEVVRKYLSIESAEQESLPHHQQQAVENRLRSTRLILAIDEFIRYHKVICRNNELNLEVANKVFNRYELLEMYCSYLFVSENFRKTSLDDKVRLLSENIGEVSFRTAASKLSFSDWLYCLEDDMKEDCSATLEEDHSAIPKEHHSVILEGGLSTMLEGGMSDILGEDVSSLLDEDSVDSTSNELDEEIGESDDELKARAKLFDEDKNFMTRLDRFREKHYDIAMGEQPRGMSYDEYGCIVL